jgi:hypothetical protein
VATTPLQVPTGSTLRSDSFRGWTTIFCESVFLPAASKPSDAHHLRYMQPRALGRKASDEFVVPLCRVHHRAVHRVGDERAWWKQTGIDPLKVARQLWKHTRVNEGRIAPRRTRKPQISIGP